MRIEFNGVVAEVEAPNPEDHICKNYWAKGLFYEAGRGQLLEWLSEQEGDTFVDVGAHWGNHTIYSYAKGNFKKIIAFEPNKHASDVLLRNISINERKHYRFDKSPRWQVLNVACGSIEGYASLVAGPENNSGMSKTRPYQFDIGQKVPVVRIDDCVDSCSVLKIDVEGSEIDVLMGAENTISTHRPKIAVECFRDNFPRVSGHLFCLGYGVSFVLTNHTPTYIFEHMES